jgi:hypothetical protein
MRYGDHPVKYSTPTITYNPAPRLKSSAPDVFARQAGRVWIE